MFMKIYMYRASFKAAAKISLLAEESWMHVYMKLGRTNDQRATGYDD